MTALADAPTEAAPTAVEALGDAALPEAAALLGPDAEAVLDVAVEATGGRVVGSERMQVMYEPGRAVAIRWNVTVDWSDGRRTEESLVAAVGPDGPPEGSFVLEAGDLRVGMYRWPHDPHLPGLVLAADSGQAPEWWEACGDNLALDVVTYRPGRRAVIHGWGDDGAVFVKVLKPHRAARLLRRYDLLAEAGVPIPQVLHADADQGVVVTAAMPGRTLRTLLAEGSTEVPSPEELVALLDRFPADLARRARRVHAPTEELDRHARTLAAVLPEAEPVLDRIRSLVGQAEVATDLVPVHGDFHDDQLLVVDGKVTGVLDVDGAGGGSRADDLGTMLGHLLNREADVALAPYSEYVTRTADLLLSGPGRQAVVRETVATMVGLATGPYRVQEDQWQERTLARLAVAEQWARSM